MRILHILIDLAAVVAMALAWAQARTIRAELRESGGEAGWGVILGFITAFLAAYLILFSTSFAGGEPGGRDLLTGGVFLGGAVFVFILLKQLRRSAARSVEVLANRLQGVLDAAVDTSIIATDTTGTITVFNRGAEKMLGWSAVEMVGKQSPAVIHVRDEVVAHGKELSRRYGRPFDGFDVFVEEARQGRHEAREWTYVRKDGTRIPVNLSVSAVRGSGGAVIGFLGVAYDLTVLRQARDAALELAKAKSEFLANMSHEIRTPMNGVIGMTGLLLDTDLDADQREYAETIRKSGDALLGIINNILDFSKIEAGRVTLEDLDFDVRELVEDVAQLFSAQARAKSIETAALVARGVPRWLKGDPGRMRQILSNIFGNAVKFTEKGSVFLRVYADGDRLVFEVRDSGLGMDEEARKNLFSPFHQADASMTRRFGGTGLGLAISRRLVEIMGGEVTVDSALGRGSVFRIALKLPEGRPTAGKTAARPPDSLRRLLIAEDNPVNQRLVLVMANSLGYAADVVADGEKALEGVKSGRYALVLMDCQMPVMDGYQAAEAIRRLPSPLSAIPVIALTANAMPGDREKALQAGMDDYLAKPLRMGDLGAALARWLGKAAHHEAEPSEPPAVDQAALEALRSIGDDGIVKEIIATYLDDSPRRMGDLRTGLQSGDPELARRAAHTLKGSSRSVGASPLGDLCQKVEEALKAADAPQARRLLPKLEAEFSRARAALEKI